LDSVPWLTAPRYPSAKVATRGKEILNKRASPRIYSSDLAFIHDAGFDWFARGAGPEMLRILRAHGVLPPRGGRPAARIVEVGCGSGILARTLTHAGYRVLGLDASPAMIRLSRARAPRAAFRVASLERARIPRCAAVISWAKW
jgi:2-polyprenyl-3-methyl-5-hydroxy-6-metoxy-1,4-benzoquinol methylase